MNERLYLPTRYIEESESSKPVIFLAGPIQGALRWQDTAIEILHKLNPDIIIASPRRQQTDSNFVYGEQVDWETFYLRRAASCGAIMFWLAKEFDHDCRRAYAQTSRFELAEWKIRHERDGIKLIVGIEEGFSGMRYILRRFSQDCPEVPITTSLEETCQKAIEEIFKRGPQKIEGPEEESISYSPPPPKPEPVQSLFIGDNLNRRELERSLEIARRKPSKT